MWRRAAPAVLLAGLWLVATGPAAGAHAVLRGSDPAGGTAPVAGSPLELRVPLGALGDGTYTVTWRAVSRMDGHVSRGAFAFGVGLPATAAPAPTRAAPAGDGLDAPSPLAVAARWSFYWGLALLVGAAATGLAVFDRRLPPRAALLLGAALALAAGGLLAMVVATSSGAGVPLGRLLESGTGRWLEARGGVLLLAAVAVGGLLAGPGPAARPGPASPRATGWLVALGLAASGGLLVHALAGHAAAPSPLRWLNLLAQWAHLLTVGTWIGGLAWLLAGIGGRPRAEVRRAVARFSLLATWSLAVVALSGLERAAEELGGWRHLLGTSFGRTLDVKLGLFAALVTLGAV